MQEASSVMKAVEKGWEAAGKPHEFTVKIFEESKKNFLGMTTQSAKIGIFFEDRKNVPTKPVHAKKAHVSREQSREATSVPAVEKRQPARQATPQNQNQQHDGETAAPQAKREVVIWQENLMQAVTKWLEGALPLLSTDTPPPFTLQPQHYNLIVTFTKPLLQSPEQEKQLFRSFSVLIMQALRHQFKRPLRGFKIILHS